MTLKSVTFKQHSLFPSLVLFFSLPPALRISVTLSFSLFNFSVTCAIFFFLPSINRAPKLTGTSGHQHRSTGHTKYYTGTTETHPVLRPLIEAENGCKKGPSVFFSFLFYSYPQFQKSLSAFTTRSSSFSLSLSRESCSFRCCLTDFQYYSISLGRMEGRRLVAMRVSVGLSVRPSVCPRTQTLTARITFYNCFDDLRLFFPPIFSAFFLLL